MKKCFKCGFTKPLSEFYKHSQTLDGYFNKCKECTKKDVYKYRDKNIEKIKAYDRNRPNHKERLKANKERLLKNPEALKKYKEKQRQWGFKNKEKRNAHCKVARALLRGILIRPVKCEKCGAIEKIEAHHDDYSKPLEVKWLCVECHNQRHKELREIKRNNEDNFFKTARATCPIFCRR